MKHKTEKYSKGFKSWDHFVSMLFCQVAQAKSLREISGGLACCNGNPGPGGYGVVLVKDGMTKEISQGDKHTTNNRMEMMAVITALEQLEDCTDRPIKIFSDSQYTLNSIIKGWAVGWCKKGWKKSDGKPALNPDLWEQMLDLVEKFPKLTFQWVKGHAGNPMNELADDLANGAAQGGDLLEDVGYQG